MDRRSITGDEQRTMQGGNRLAEKAGGAQLMTDGMRRWLPYASGPNPNHALVREGCEGAGRGTIDNILAYVHDHYTTDLSLDMLADHTGLHPNYISALFKKRMGVPFLKYLHTYRIERAKMWISRQPSLPVREISGKVGFENENHFYHLFKRYTGMTPGEFRTRYVAR